MRFNIYQNENDNWTKDSWQNCEIRHIPDYKNAKLLQEAKEELETYPPLVFAEEIRSLQDKLSLANDGEAFLLQGGTCAESFRDFNAPKIRDIFKLIMQMAAILTFAGGKQVVKVGRIAGQFAKPRSNPTEMINGAELLSYRGDMINGIEETSAARKPDPMRMIKCYQQSAATLNLLRAFANGGLANLTNIHKFNLDFVKNSNIASRFEGLSHDISKALQFMQACGIDIKNMQEFSKSDFFTSHEALFLPYEEALCRIDSLTNKIYDCSAHLLWLGERTRFHNSAHIEFLRGVNNPIGIKVGNDDFSTTLKTIETLNKTNEKGKIIIIARFGKQKIEKILPKLIKTIEENGLNVVWSCDPMHGNTYKSTNNFKTRKFLDILDEIKLFFQIHKESGTYAGGVHLEISEEDVTECIGGLQDITEESLSHCYTTHCDPRLNASQSLELAFTISDYLKKE